MNSAGTLHIEGVRRTAGTEQLAQGWNLIGCPYTAAVPFANDFNATNCVSIKSFEGTWAPAGGLNSITGFEPGKAYFILKK